MSDFDIGDAPAIEAGVYVDEMVSLPTAAWHGKATQENAPGFWSISQAKIDTCPTGWKAHEMQLGPPTEPLSAVYVTHRLRCIIRAVRKRFIVTAENGTKHFFPFYTNKQTKEHVIGSSIASQKAHIQVMVQLIGDEPGPIVLGLRGYSKTAAWTNNGNMSAEWAIGVEPTLQAYAAGATAYYKKEKGYTGQPFPWRSMWTVDLIPQLNPDNTATFIHVGKGTYMNLFEVDMTVGDGTKYPKSRYVGEQTFNELKDMYANHDIDWEKQWGTHSEAAERDDNGNGASEPIGTEEDAIPF